LAQYLDVEDRAGVPVDIEVAAELARAVIEFQSTLVDPPSGTFVASHEPPLH
jgi:hypothetical protein